MKASQGRRVLSAQDLDFPSLSSFPPRRQQHYCSHNRPSICSHFGTHDPDQWSNEGDQRRLRAISQSHTEVTRGIAGAPPAHPVIVSRTMGILVMLVPDFAEEVDAVRAHEQRSGDRMNRRVAPALFCAQSPVRVVRFASRSQGKGGERRTS